MKIITTNEFFTSISLHFPTTIQRFLQRQRKTTYRNWAYRNSKMVNRTKRKQVCQASNCPAHSCIRALRLVESIRIKKLQKLFGKVHEENLMASNESSFWKCYWNFAKNAFWKIALGFCGRFYGLVFKYVIMNHEGNKNNINYHISKEISKLEDTNLNDETARF